VSDAGSSWADKVAWVCAFVAIGPLSLQVPITLAALSAPTNGDPQAGMGLVGLVFWWLPLPLQGVAAVVGLGAVLWRWWGRG
jgi:hypothetical protein